MLEIIIIWLLCKKIAAIAKGKGRSAAGYVLLLIGMWLGGEILEPSPEPSSAR